MAKVRHPKSAPNTRVKQKQPNNFSNNDKESPIVVTTVTSLRQKEETVQHTTTSDRKKRTPGDVYMMEMIFTKKNDCAFVT